MAEIFLPKEKIKATLQDPRNLIIFSKPKQGKTTAIANLPNCLIFDTEQGSLYVDALKIQINSISDLNNVCKAIIKAGRPYKFIAIDTMTALEDMSKPLALKLAMNTPLGSKLTPESDILNLANGAGYKFWRDAIEMLVSMVSKCADNIILICHTKDAAVANSDVTVKAIDLSGKESRVLASKSDAIGYLERDEDSNTILSFNANDKYVECGSRPEHLKNKDVVLGEMQKDGTIVYHWERIYPSLANDTVQ